MKLTKDQTDALERVHKAFTEFNEAVRALGVKGFKLRIVRAEKGAFHPFEVKSITYSQPLTMADVKQAIEDRMKAEVAELQLQQPKPMSNADIAAARRPTPTVKTCDVLNCNRPAVTGAMHCEAHIGRGPGDLPGNAE